MKWNFIRAIKEDSLLEEMEAEYAIVFPSDYKELVLNNNAGIPEKTVFFAQGETCEFERLISIKRKDDPNIKSAMEWLEQSESELMIPIALDTEGSMICLSFAGAKTQVVFVGFSSGEATVLADSLTEFIATLR